MEFLLDLGFSELDIEQINKCNFPYIMENIVLNKENIITIIRYLFEIGIEKSTIKEIMMYQISLMFKTKEEIKTSFDEYELDSVVKSLNYDANNVELIDFI
jgi:hypothetical protein